MGWKEVSLSQVAAYSQGKQIPVEEQFESQQENMSRFIRIVDYTSGGSEPPRFVNTDEKYSVSETDIIMIRYGSRTAGNVYRGISGIIANNMFRIVVDEKVIDKDYAYWFLNQEKIVRQLNASQSSSTMPAITFGMLKSIMIPIPPKSVQKRIADILSSLDAKIENNNKINAKLEEMAQALFKSWFIDFEPFKDRNFIESELGMIPEGWKVGAIGDYCKMRSGYAFKSSWWTDKGCKIIKIKNISESGNIDLTDCSFVAPENCVKAEEFKAKAGDLVLAMTGATIGKFNVIPYIDEPFYINQRVGKFFLGEKPIEKLPFIYCLLKQESITNTIINKGQGSAQPNISGSDVDSISIAINWDCINKFNKMFSPVFEMIMKNQKENIELAQTRDTLLPKLMSGEIEL